MDGRLVNTLNSRITVKNDEEGDRTFQYGRPHLHLVRLRKEVEKENHVPVLRKHEECQQNSWLEIRAGDAALLDMNSVSCFLIRAQSCSKIFRLESIKPSRPTPFWIEELKLLLESQRVPLLTVFLLSVERPDLYSCCLPFFNASMSFKPQFFLNK